MFQYLEDFIDTRLVDLVFQDKNIEDLTSHLYPGNSLSAFVLTHDVETLAGFKNIPKVLELINKGEEQGVPEEKPNIKKQKDPKQQSLF